MGRTPVTGAPIIGGLMPSNAVPQEIHTDHPDRFRAMIVESGNPAHSIADSAACRAAFESLELLVVIDVAMTETARLAHYVLPGGQPVREARGDVLQSRVPAQHFHLRRPLFEPLPGHAARTGDLGPAGSGARRGDEDDLRPLREAAARGPGGLPAGFFSALAANPTLARCCRTCSTRRLDPRLPEGLPGAAALWGLAQKTVMTYPDAVRRAGHADGDALFDAILSSRSAITFTAHEYADDWALITHADHKIALSIPELLADLRALQDARPG